MKTKPRTTRSEVIFRKAKFIFLNAAFGLPTMKTKMFLQTRTNIFFLNLVLSHLIHVLFS